MRPLFALAVCSCAAVQPVPSAKSSAPPAATLVIRNVRVFDGEAAHAPTSVAVSGDRIIGLVADVAVPTGAQVVDGTGMTLLPGFIDSHAHVSDEKQLEQSAVFGVTTVLDMGCGNPSWGQQLKRLSAAPHSTVADLRFAGYAVTAPGAHCTEYGIPVPTLTQPEEAEAFVVARLAEGSDYIKLVYDDYRVFGLSIPTLSKATLGAGIAAAHRHGRLALVHIASQQAALDALELGADGLMHSFLDGAPSRELSEQLAAHHAFLVPTLSVNLSAVGRSGGPALLADARLSPWLSRQAGELLQARFPAFPKAHVDYHHAEQTVAALEHAQVPVLAGSDAPNPGTTYGATMHGELELLVASGLTPTAALAAATSRPATQFHLDDRGRVKPGLRADLMLVEGDLTNDITATRNIVAVWRGGVLVDRSGHRARIDEERKQVAAPPAGSESGLVSDFETLEPRANFGSWAVTTDALVGGKSTARLSTQKGGASASKGALRIEGSVVAGFPYPWAGVMFSPAEQPMTAANLSSKKQLVFSTRGVGTFRVLVFTESQGPVPAAQTFKAGKEWKQVRFSLSDFNGTDAHDLLGIAFVGGPDAGEFRFELDDVRLE